MTSLSTYVNPKAGLPSIWKVCECRFEAIVIGLQVWLRMGTATFALKRDRKSPSGLNELKYQQSFKI